MIQSESTQEWAIVRAQPSQNTKEKRRRNKDGWGKKTKSRKTMAVFSHAHPRCLSEDCVKPCLSSDVVLYGIDEAGVTGCSYMFENFS